ncbi:MAG: hypothetical protein R2729_10440 [Bryobacteraceae bacterium]
MRPAAAILALTALAHAAELIDRTAVVVDHHVITASEVDEQLSAAEFLNREPLDKSAARRRRAAEQLVEQTLLRREMEITGYQPPPPSDAEPLLKQVKGARPDFDVELAKYGIDEAALRRILLWQLTTIRFVELRFRPGSAVSDSEVAEQYREKYIPEWQRAHPGGEPPPDIEDVRERIEGELIEQKVDRALDTWLQQAREQVRIRFVDAAFQEPSS